MKTAAYCLSIIFKSFSEISPQIEQDFVSNLSSGITNFYPFVILTIISDFLYSPLESRISLGRSTYDARRIICTHCSLSRVQAINIRLNMIGLGQNSLFSNFRHPLDLSSGFLKFASFKLTCFFPLQSVLIFSFPFL